MGVLNRLISPFIFSKTTNKLLMLSVWNIVLFPTIQKSKIYRFSLKLFNGLLPLWQSFVHVSQYCFAVGFLLEKLPILKENFVNYKNEGSSAYSKSSQFKRPTCTGSGTARTNDRTSPIRKVSRTQKSWRQWYKKEA